MMHDHRLETSPDTMQITDYFLWACSLFSTTLFGVPFPLPTPQGRRAQQLKTRPECWIRGLHEASTQGIEATSANLFRKECLGMQRSPKAMLLRPTNIDLPACEISCRQPRYRGQPRYRVMYCTQPPGTPVTKLMPTPQGRRPPTTSSKRGGVLPRVLDAQK